MVVLIEYTMSLEECALRDSTVLLLRLDNHDGLILKVIVDDQISDSEVFKTALNNMLFAETVESQDLSHQNVNFHRSFLNENLPVYQA